MTDINNKNIIITGASGGIGNSIVEKLSEAGANILASGTKLDKLKELKNKFNNIKILKFDISQSEKIEEFIENATNENTYIEEGSVTGIEYRSYSATLYPYFSNELMTQTIDDTTIISPITVGFLEDLNYDISYNSFYISRPEYYEGGYDISRITIDASNNPDSNKQYALSTYYLERNSIFYQSKVIKYSKKKNYTTFTFTKN